MSIGPVGPVERDSHRPWSAKSITAGIFVTVVGGLILWGIQRNAEPPSVAPPASTVASPGASGASSPTSVPSSADASQPRPATSSVPTQPSRTAEAGASTDHTFQHDVDTAGQVWIRLLPQDRYEGEPHKIRVVWGPWQYQDTFTLNGPLVLLHTKEAGTSYPLTVHVEPAAHARIGHGSAPQGRQVDTNGLWTRRS